MQKVFGARFWQLSRVKLGPLALLASLILTLSLDGCRSTRAQSAGALEEGALELSIEAQEGLHELSLRKAYSYIAKETKAHGGITYDVKQNKKVPLGEKAYAVSLAGGRVLPASASESDIAAEAEALVLEYADEFFLRGYRLGTWLDEQSQQIFIDRTLLLYYSPATRDETLRSCLDVARREGQKAVFDMATGQSILLK